MADLPPPETMRQPTGDIVHVNNTQGLNTLSIGGKTYQILDTGYMCGNTACTVLSEFTCLISPAPYCVICATCLHPEGAPPVPVPDYVICGVPAGIYGILVKFKPPWMCHCLKMLGYVSANVNLIQPIGTAPMCGAPSIPPPLHGFNPFPLVAGALAIGSATLPSGATVSFDTDGGGTPYRPGLDDLDIDYLPPSPPGTIPSEGCLDVPENTSEKVAEDKCSPTAPENAVILTIPKIV
jgi:hypothetical protein